MNENINLCRLLKGHEGETFYNAIRDNDVVLNKILDVDDGYICVEDKEPCNLSRCLPQTKSSFVIYNDGSLCKNGFCTLFPSKDQRDWNKWAEEQKPKLPKTWSELIKARNVKTLGVSTIESPYCSISIVAYDRRRETIRETPIEKSALALLKIHQLIEVGYGGNITNEEWKNQNIRKYSIYYLSTFIVDDTVFKNSIAFHTENQAKEFLSYRENIKLLRDYYMI